MMDTKMTTEEAIAELDGLPSPSPEQWGMPEGAWDADDAKALHHLISEARKVDAQRKRIEELVIERDALLGKSGNGPTETYYLLIEELGVPPGGSLVETVERIKSERDDTIARAEQAEARVVESDRQCNVLQGWLKDARTLIERYRVELTAALNLCPEAIRIREGGGEEDILSSVAVTMSKLSGIIERYREALTPAKIETAFTGVAGHTGEHLFFPLIGIKEILVAIRERAEKGRE